MIFSSQSLFSFLKSERRKYEFQSITAGRRRALAEREIGDHPLLAVVVAEGDARHEVEHPPLLKLVLGASVAVQGEDLQQRAFVALHVAQPRVQRLAVPAARAQLTKERVMPRSPGGTLVFITSSVQQLSGPGPEVCGALDFRNFIRSDSGVHGPSLD